MILKEGKFYEYLAGYSQKGHVFLCTLVAIDTNFGELRAYFDIDAHGKRGYLMDGKNPHTNFLCWKEIEQEGSKKSSEPEKGKPGLYFDRKKGFEVV